MNTAIRIALLLIGLINVSAKNSENEHLTPPPEIVVLEQWSMPSELTEISGLAYMDHDRFACVEDETGVLFIYDVTSKKIQKRITFAGPGDYEDIAWTGENAYIIRSDGHLFELENAEQAKPIIREYVTGLTARHNVEGLCLDKQNNRLLLAIKGEDPAHADYKGVYAFDLSTKKLNSEPVIRITSLNNSNKGNKKKNADMINPSAITIQSSTKEIFILDGPKSRLLVLDSSGQIKNLYQLNAKIFPQPEGITFNNEGELFISSEGVKQAASMAKVEVKNVK